MINACGHSAAALLDCQRFNRIIHETNYY